jgi:Carboxypeptidase regulatory-like domain
MKSIYRTLGWVMVVVLVLAASAAAKPGFGTISGVVLDPSGTSQMGASIWLISEDGGGSTVAQILSNQYGAFFTDRLKPGEYAVRVSVAGFLPAMQRHVAVMSNLTTLLRVQVETVFSSLDTLRRKSDASPEPDDWKWVLRSSAATRTILQWDDSSSEAASNTLGEDLPKSQRPRALVQVSNGALRPGSASNFPSAPATAVSYDQSLGSLGRMLVAGQMGYDKGASGSFASVWLPSSIAGGGPETVFVWRQSKFGAEGMEFRAMRIDHTEQFNLGEKFLLRAGAEYLRAGIISSVSSLRPHAQLDAKLATNLTASLILASNPPSEQWGRAGALESAIDELDSLPPVLFRYGNPVLEGGWHQEASVKRKMSSKSTFEVAAFHDSSRDEAIFGTGAMASPEFIQDAFSPAFLYDGGNSSSWGTRAAYRQKLSDDVEVAAIYAWAGALSPGGELNSAATDLRDSFSTRNHHSVAARISGKIPQSGTQFSASYKWISGTALTRMDQFGEAAYGIDPNLHLSIRQPLPGLDGHWEALADFSNLLAQGYVTVNGQDSRMTLVPMLRSFRGGVSFQF